MRARAGTEGTSAGSALCCEADRGKRRPGPSRRPAADPKRPQSPCCRRANTRRTRRRFRHRNRRRYLVPLRVHRRVSAGARAVRPGGHVLASIWPPETRPTAANDLARVMAELREWADVTMLPIELSYEAPPFELVAMSIAKDEPLARSPRHGRLVRLEATSSAKNIHMPCQYSQLAPVLPGRLPASGSPRGQYNSEPGRATSQC